MGLMIFAKLTFFFYFQESFRPSLSPTGDVFDDRKIDITSAIVSGFKTEQNLTDQAENQKSAEENSSGEKESSGMDLEPTEATENPLQSGTTKSPDDDNAEDNPVESESSSATTVEVKGKISTVYITGPATRFDFL